MSESGDIAERVKRYFARQIAWLEIQGNDLDALPQGLEGAALDGIVIRQAQREREGAEFAREQQALLREWQAASVETEVRDEIRALAAEAEALAANLRATYERVAKRLDAATGTPKASLDTVKRGRRMLDSYRPTDSDASDFLDRRA